MDIFSFSSVQFHGILLVLAGLLIRFIIGYRRFNRRGIAGLQHFSSYPVALLVLFIEWIFNLLGLLAILAGTLLLLLEWFNGLFH
ncbi:hypothetical protein [Chitinophaga japonensis]|uniref:Uncharacterized protein n=1 Tax=Chitinophaga japonensis TaxID=104662 RepID=A0A562T2B9_CHIJA|nr:hypothetical protein [Chitinophaga japonensis]TWI87815.1 hypothetical protein LX66_1886 [Chitinophaga japonensis]